MASVVVPVLLLAAGARAGGGGGCSFLRSPSPSCMLNGEPCPLPGWAPDWSLRNSTAMMAEHWIWAGPVKPIHHWGLLSIDHGCNRGGKQGPTNHGWNRLGPAQATCEATSAANCLALKEAGLVTRCGIYHNLELSLQWLESQRAVMDEAHVAAGWFLRFPGNGSVFQHDIPEGKQWTIDWRNPAAAQYFVQSIVNATMQPGVDVTFTDDREGVPCEHPEVQPDLNMSNSALADLRASSLTLRHRRAGSTWLPHSLRRIGRADCIGGTQGEHNIHGPPAGVEQCTAYMRSLCAPSMQGRGMFMAWSAGTANQTLAAFLITRPPIAFLGGRLDDHDWHPLFALDVGEPLDQALCQETNAGVFSRRWTKGTARLDCRTFTAQIPFDGEQDPPPLKTDDEATIPGTMRKPPLGFSSWTTSPHQVVV